MKHSDRERRLLFFAAEQPGYEVGERGEGVTAANRDLEKKIMKYEYTVKRIAEKYRSEEATRMLEDSIHVLEEQREKGIDEFSKWLDIHITHWEEQSRVASDARPHRDSLPNALQRARMFGLESRLADLRGKALELPRKLNVKIDHYATSLTSLEQKADAILADDPVLPAWKTKIREARSAFAAKNPDLPHMKISDFERKLDAYQQWVNEQSIRLDSFRRPAQILQEEERREVQGNKRLADIESIASFIEHSVQRIQAIDADLRAIEQVSRARGGATLPKHLQGIDLRQRGMDLRNERQHLLGTVDARHAEFRTLARSADSDQAKWRNADQKIAGSLKILRRLQNPSSGRRRRTA